MKILMVLEVDFPPDDRVEKEAISLIEKGHEVDIACYTRTGKPTKENYKGIGIIRKSIPAFIYKSGAACLVLPFYFHFWKKFLFGILVGNNYSAIHVHDLPLSKVACKLAKKYQLKIIFDQHEYYSNWIIHTRHYQKGLGRIIRLFSRWESYEKKYLSQADFVITVEEPLRQKYIQRIHVDPGKIICVPNTPLGKLFNPGNVKKEIAERYRDQFVLFYAGGLDSLRGLDIPLKAMSIVRDKISGLKLILAGRLNKGFDILGLIEELQISDIVEYLNWIDIQDMPSYLAVTTVGFFTPPGNRDEIHDTIATKIYQYLAMNVPVIVSDVKHMKEFVLGHEIGFVAGNEKDFADIVLDLYENPGKRKALADTCNNYNKDFIWEKTVSGLLDYYSQLA